jgi:hypothetical protein
MGWMRARSWLGLRGAAAVLCVGALLLATRPARAALTDSEKAQIKGFVQQAQLASAPRVRAMVARPDLSLEESTQALADALVPVPLQDSGATYLRELIFGGPSLSGRSVLVSAVTRALLARADAILSRYAADLDKHTDALAELARIYVFLDTQIANAGHPGALPAHDPQAGIPSSTYDDCVRALADHIQRNPRWLIPQLPVSLTVARVRAAAEIALFEMMTDSPTRRVDAASALGLSGGRRKVLIDRGILILDDGVADDARLGRVLALLQRLSATFGARSFELEAIDFGDPRPPLHPRGTLIGVAVPLEMAPSQAQPFGSSDEIDLVPLDLPLFVLAYELAKPAAARVLTERPDLRKWADQDVQASQAPAGSMTTEERVAGMMAQLLVDAPRTFDLAFARFLAGRTRTAGLVSDSLGVLALLANPGAPPAAGMMVGLGHSAGTGGETERVDASALRLTGAGAATSFVFGPHRWDIGRDSLGVVDGVRCDGQPATFAVLRTARVPVTEALSWTAGGLVFARLAGAPRAGVAAGSRIRVVGVGTGDAIATPAPGDDVVIEGDLSVAGGEGGIVARAVSTKGSFQGVSLLLIPGGAAAPGPTRAVLRISDGVGGETNLGQPVSVLGSGSEAHFKLTLKGATVEALVESVPLKGALPPSLAHGDVGVRAHAGATVEVSALSIRRR